jgi:GAF domain-containing protein
MATATERLHLLYEISRRLTTLLDLDELTRYATQRTRELFKAEGCALLLLDRERNQFYFPTASQAQSRQEVQARLAEIRFPADRGIAGWVLRRGEAALVLDTTKDERFYDSVDKLTAMSTRSLLCAPLRSPSGNIGVIEVVNPQVESLTNEDLEFLEAVAGDIGIAYEKAQLYARLRGEVIGLRQACAFAGFGLVATGLVFSVAVTLGHLARALPLSELFSRPAMIAGTFSLAIGSLLLGVWSGWLVKRVSETAP